MRYKHVCWGPPYLPPLLVKEANAVERKTKKKRKYKKSNIKSNEWTFNLAVINTALKFTGGTAMTKDPRARRAVTVVSIPPKPEPRTTRSKS